MSLKIGSSKHFRSIAQDDMAQLPAAKKQKPNMDAQNIFRKTFEYLDDIGALLCASRTARGFNKVVQDWYADRPGFGTKEEIFARVTPSILETQKQGGQCHIDGNEIGQSCAFAEARLKRLAPGQTLFVRSGKDSPRPFLVIGEEGHLIFDRRDKNDRSLSAAGAAFKEVWLCYSLNVGASRTWSTIALNTPDRVRVAMQEANMAFQAHGLPNLAQIFHIFQYSIQAGSSQPQQKMAFIGAFYNGDDLLDALNQKRLLKLDALAILMLIHDICNGIVQLHKRRIVHRDLKPDNIMLDQQPGGRLTAQIIDFGAASAAGSQSDYNSMTARYFAPEVCRTFLKRSPSPCDYKSDSWALGDIIYRIATNCVPPFYEKPVENQIKKVAQLQHVDLAMPQAGSLYEILYPLIDHLFRINSEERLAPEQALQWIASQIQLRTKS